MHSLLIALVACAAPPSPGSFSGAAFYDEAFVQPLSDEALATRGWPSLEFPSHGVVLVDDGEVERFSFTATRDSSGFVLTLKGADGKAQIRYWRWLDADHAATNLWGGGERIASRKKPTPAERRDAYGVTLASRQLAPGAFLHKKSLAFELQADGGVRWGPAGRGTFFTCQTECAPDARNHLCLRLDSNGSEFLFRGSDAGPEALPVRASDACGARGFAAGEPLPMR